MEAKQQPSQGEEEGAQGKGEEEEAERGREEKRETEEGQRGRRVRATICQFCNFYLIN